MGKEDETPWYEQKSFLAERKKWYAKLKEEGFEDIELINWHDGSAWERMDGVSQADICNTYTPEKERYYQLAKQFYWEMPAIGRKDWTSKKPRVKRWPRVRKVWKLHAEGLSVREIGRRLDLGTMTVQRDIEQIRPLFMEWVQEHERY